MEFFWRIFKTWNVEFLEDFRRGFLWVKRGVFGGLSTWIFEGLQRGFLRTYNVDFLEDFRRGFLRVFDVDF